jgi:hypothetical protein
MTFISKPAKQSGGLNNPVATVSGVKQGKSLLKHLFCV